MNVSLHKISLYILYLMPISLITGPAIPDISISLICIFFLIHSIKNKEFKWIGEKWIRNSILFWLSLIFISFFAINKKLSFADSIIFIRFILFSIALYVWILQDKKQLKKLLLIIFISSILIIFDSFLQVYRYSPSIGYGKDIFGFLPTNYQRLTGPFDEEVVGSYLAKFYFLSIVSK